MIVIHKYVGNRMQSHYRTSIWCRESGLHLGESCVRLSAANTLKRSRSRHVIKIGEFLLAFWVFEPYVDGGYAIRRGLENPTKSLLHVRNDHVVTAPYSEDIFPFWSRRTTCWRQRDAFIHELLSILKLIVRSIKVISIAASRRRVFNAAT